jgi:phenylacetyl-CoA:acceptor oxidoreductase subunit 2
MSYGPAPWRQRHWDARAAGNFICGGAGSGLLVFTALSDAQGPALAMLVLAGVALVGLGLFCVWLEIGRPLRALHVFINPRTSWMAREACVAALLFPLGLAIVAGAQGLVPIFAGARALLPVVGALAVLFAYCQGRMLTQARGIPAWREPLVAPLLVVTALVEGGGLFFASDAWHRQGTEPLFVLFGTLVLARVLVWLVYRWRVAAGVDRRALEAIDDAGLWLQLVGTLVPLVLVGAAALVAMDTDTRSLLAAVAGLLAAATGAYVKLVLVLRASFNQGFALAHLPVRGQRPAT